MARSAPRRRLALPELSLRLLVLSGLWTVMAGPGLDSWLIGGPVVLAALWSSTRLTPTGRGGFSLRGVALFLPYFMWESLKGGTDVALRVLGPRMRIDPGLRTYRTGLTRPGAQVLFLDMVSLLPGTLSADIEGDNVLIHALDRSTDLEPELQRLERRIAALFADRIEGFGPVEGAARG